MGPVKVEYSYETVKGEHWHGTACSGIGTKPWLMVFMLTEGIERDGWKVQKLHDPDDPMSFVIIGSKSSPIKSVTITGDTSEPIVERRFRPAMKGQKK